MAQAVEDAQDQKATSAGRAALRDDRMRYAVVIERKSKEIQEFQPS